MKYEFLMRCVLGLETSLISEDQSTLYIP